MRKSTLRAAAAWQALALLGAGATGAIMVAAPAHAQDYTNITANGRVQGTAGQPIAGAVVTIQSNELGLTRTATTGPDGSFVIPQLPPGEYSFSITAPGFDTYTETGVTLNRESSANEFTLASTGAAATNTGGEIVVVGRRRIVDFDRTTTGAVIEIGELAQRVPVSRDLTSVVQLAPATTVGDTAFGSRFTGYLPSIAGSSVAENAYYINGLNITDFRKGLGAVTVPFEFYDTVEVKNGGYQAEFGRSTGGVINATTKRGGNDFHAGMLFTWEPNSLAEDAKNTIFQDNDADYAESVSANFYASGPIIKDRLFVYGLYNPRFLKVGDGLTEAGGGQYITQTIDDPFYGLKLDAIPIDGHLLEFTYFDTRSTTKRVIEEYDADTNTRGDYLATELSKTGGKNYVGRYTGTLTDWLTISAAYGKNRSNDSTLSSSTLPFIVDNREGFPNIIGNFTNINETYEDERTFYRGDVDLYFNAFGSHHVKFGYDREDLESTVFNEYPSGSYYQYFVRGPGCSAALGICEGTEYVVARTRTLDGSFSSKNTAYYIQDSWRLLDNRLTLQLGIRNDNFKNYNSDGVAFYESGDQWGPRVGFTFDPTGDALTKIYGSYGRYFLPVAANTNQRLAGNEYDVDEYFLLEGLNANGTARLGDPINGPGLRECLRTGLDGGMNANCNIRATGEVTPTENTVAKNLKPQAMDEWILGAERRLGDRWRVGVYGTYRKLLRALEDVAIDQAALAYCEANGYVMENEDGTGCASIYTGFSQYVLVNPGVDSEITLFPIGDQTAGDTVTLTADQLGYPKAIRKYKAITFTFEREFDGIWSLAGSYTWSKLKGNYEGAVKSDNGQDDAGLTQDFDQPGLMPGAYGYLPGDRRHNFKLYGSYQVTPWFLAGANLQVTSPRRFGCIGYVDPAFDPFAFVYGAAGNYCPLVDGELDPDIPTDEFVVVPRGTAFKSDWLSTLNLSAVFQLPTDALDAQFRLDVFNVLNSKAVTDRREFGTDDEGGVDEFYKEPTGYQQPRYVRLSFSTRF